MSDSVFYVHGVPVAILSGDGRYRKVELSPEDRAGIEKKLYLIAQPVVASCRQPQDLNGDLETLA